MAQFDRTDRRRAPLADFDDQRWPIAAALLLLAGLAAFVIWQRSDFTDQRPLDNGWTRLVIVAATLVVLIWGSALLEQRVLRRLQLCILLSLLFHLGLGGALREQYLDLVAIRQRAQQESEALVPDPLPAPLPDYEFDSIDAVEPTVVDESLVEPIATDPAEALEESLSRQDEEPSAPATNHPVFPEPVLDATQPEVQDQRRAEVSAPHKAATAGESISRQELRPDIPALEAQPQPQFAPQAESAAEEIQPQRQSAREAPRTPGVTTSLESTEPEPATLGPPVESSNPIGSAAPALEPVLESAPADAARTSSAVPVEALADGRAEPSALPTSSDRSEPRQSLAPVSGESTRIQQAPSSSVISAPTAGLTTTVPARPRGLGTGSAGATRLESNPSPTTESEPDAVPRRQTIAAIPSGAMKAEEVRVAGAAGGDSPAPIEASGSAATAPRQFRGSGGTVPASSSQAPSALAPSVASLPRRGAAAVDPAQRDASVEAPATGGVTSSETIRGASRGRSTTPAADLAASSDARAEGFTIGPTPDGPARGGSATVQRAGEATSQATGGSSDPLSPSTARVGRMTASSPAAPRGGPVVANPAAVASSVGPMVDIPARPGAGGIRRDRAPALGVNDPLARRQSDTLQSLAGRFVLERSFGSPTINARINENPIPAFRQRRPAEREKNAPSRGATAGSEKAVELGLDFLARHQSADGRWSLDKFDGGRPGYERAGQGQMQSDTAATGLALLAFFGAGYTHLDGKYRLVVGGGLDYLVGNQKPDGDLFNSGSQYVWLYSHGIASIALCEAYGMTRDPRLREPAQRALDFIIAAQHPTEGGWRYAPQRESDTSVSGWQMMALKSGELAGLAVPQTTYERLSGWLDYAQAPGMQGAQYVYLPASRQLQQRSPSIVMTAEALLMRLYLGWERDDARLVMGADVLLENLPQFGTPNEPHRDAYYWYYATQVMFQVQGPHWEAWNARLRDLLVNSQVQEGLLAGSWDPMGAVPDRWGRPGGRVYVTAMHLLMLEVYYRHLPLYKTLAK